MAYPGRHNIYEAAIRRMVQQALEEQERSSGSSTKWIRTSSCFCTCGNPQ